MVSEKDMLGMEIVGEKGRHMVGRNWQCRELLRKGEGR